MHRESRILMAAGFVLLFATLGAVWFRTAPPAVRTAAAFAVGTDPDPRRPLVGIVFTPQDCGTLVEQLRLWNEPYLARDARVRGLVNLAGTEEEDVWKVVRGAGLRFPVDRARSATLLQVQRALGYRVSFVVVFDGAGRVRRATPLEDLADPHARADLVEFVRSLRGVPGEAPLARR